MTTPFKPSHVALTTPPLTATMGKTEVECAAAVIVFALARGGDEWRPITAKEVGGVIRHAMDNGVEPVKSWSSNPFLTPDFAGLIAGGFVTRTPSDDGAVLEFVPAAIERLRPWVLGLASVEGARG